MTGTNADIAATLEELLGLPLAEQVARVRSAADPDALVLQLSDSADRIAAADIGRGLAVREALVALADELGSPVARSEARSALATSLAYCGRLDEAVLVANTAVEIAVGNGLKRELGRAHMAALQALFRLGRFDEALASGFLARAAFEEVGAQDLVVRADTNLGAVCHSRGDLSSALEHYDRAHRMANGDVLAQIQSNRGLVLMGLGRLEESKEALDLAGELFAREGLHWSAAMVEQNLAYLFVRKGELHQAMFHFERGRRQLESEGSIADVAMLDLDYADGLAALGLAAEAADRYQSAIPTLDSLELANESGTARLGLGLALLRLNRELEAEPVLLAALGRFRDLGMAPSAAQAAIALARIDLAAGDAERAAGTVREALDALGDLSLDALAARALLGRALLAAGESGEALAEANLAIETATDLDLAPMLADLLHLRAKIRLATGDLDGAAEDFREAIAQVERVRGMLQAERFRSGWLGDRLELYDDALLAALDRGPAGVAEAFAFAEQAKGRALLDLASGMLETEAATMADPAEARLLEDLARVRAELEWHYSELAQQDGSALGDASWQERVHRLERELDLLQDRLASTRGVGGLFAPTIGLDGALALVDDGSALVEYVEAHDELIAFVLRDGVAHAVRTLATTGELAGLADRFQFQVARALAAGPEAMATPRGERMTLAARADLAALYEKLIRPLEGHLSGAGRLTIVPHGVLHGLPFAALYDEEKGEYLAQRAEITAAPSASLLARLGRGSMAIDGGAPLVVAVADPAAPRIAEEAADIAATLGDAELVSGGEATVSRVRDAGARPLIHFACHGRFDPENP
ncbi:MAG: CHAT domain-containing protein, partial [Chloroflexota bacterium]